MLLGRLSISVSMVAPVVVKPETVSNQQSVKLGIEPLIQNGSAPKKDIAIHARATITKPSLAYIPLSGLFILEMAKPMANIAAATSKNAVTTTNLAMQTVPIFRTFLVAMVVFLVDFLQKVALVVLAIYLAISFLLLVVQGQGQGKMQGAKT